MEGEVYDLAYLGDMTVLPRQAFGRSGGEGQRAEQLASHRRSADLERPRLDFLRAGRRRCADALGSGR